MAGWEHGALSPELVRTRGIRHVSVNVKSDRLFSRTGSHLRLGRSRATKNLEHHQNAGRSRERGHKRKTPHWGLASARGFIGQNELHEAVLKSDRNLNLRLGAHRVLDSLEPFDFGGALFALHQMASQSQHFGAAEFAIDVGGQKILSGSAVHASTPESSR